METYNVDLSDNSEFLYWAKTTVNPDIGFDPKVSDDEEIPHRVH